MNETNVPEVYFGQTVAIASARTSLESHLMAFAAEESRHRNIVIDMDEFRQRSETV